MSLGESGDTSAEALLGFMSGNWFYMTPVGTEMEKWPRQGHGGPGQKALVSSSRLYRTRSRG